MQCRTFIYLLFSQFKYEIWCIKSVMDGAFGYRYRCYSHCCDSRTLNQVGRKAVDFTTLSCYSIYFYAAMPISSREREIANDF